MAVAIPRLLTRIDAAVVLARRMVMNVVVVVDAVLFLLFFERSFIHAFMCMHSVVSYYRTRSVPVIEGLTQFFLFFFSIPPIAGQEISQHTPPRLNQYRYI
jgi:hypothetical protein